MNATQETRNIFTSADLRDSREIIDRIGNLLACMRADEKPAIIAMLGLVASTAKDIHIPKLAIDELLQLFLILP